MQNEDDFKLQIRRSFLLYVSRFVFVFIALALIIERFVPSQGLYTYINLFLLLFAFVSLVLLKFNKVFASATIFTFSGFVMIFYSTFFISPNNAFYFVFFPIIPFFLFGRKWGGVWTAATLVAMVIGNLTRSLTSFKVYFSGDSLLQLFVSFFCATLTIYLYQVIVDKSETALSEKRRSLEIANKQLSEEVSVRLKTQEELASKVKTLEEFNEVMVGRELEMKKLKEENERLKVAG